MFHCRSLRTLIGSISKAPEHNRVPGLYILTMKEAVDTGQSVCQSLSVSLLVSNQQSVSRSQSVSIPVSNQLAVSYSFNQSTSRSRFVSVSISRYQSVSVSISQYCMLQVHNVVNAVYWTLPPLTSAGKRIWDIGDRGVIR